MSDLDILGALEAAPEPEDRPGCHIGRWLALIPTDTPGLELLITMLSTPTPGTPGWRRLEDIAAILRRLGRPASLGVIGAHRLGMCRCFR